VIIYFDQQKVFRIGKERERCTEKNYLKSRLNDLDLIEFVRRERFCWKI